MCDLDFGTSHSSGETQLRVYGATVDDPSGHHARFLMAKTASLGNARTMLCDFCLGQFLG